MSTKDKQLPPLEELERRFNELKLSREGVEFIIKSDGDTVIPVVHDVPAKVRCEGHLEVEEYFKHVERARAQHARKLKRLRENNKSVRMYLAKVETKLAQIPLDGIKVDIETDDDRVWPYLCKGEIILAEGADQVDLFLSLAASAPRWTAEQREDAQATFGCAPERVLEDVLYP
jgi:hypothetical protein